jgi:hypothetical protein
MTENLKVRVFSFLTAFYFGICTAIYMIDRELGDGEASIPAAIVKGSVISVLAAPFIYKYFRSKAS